MMGSILAQTGMPACVRVLIACILCVVEGTLGSSFLARSSLSVVMVKTTTVLVFCRMSVSLVTMFDLVMI